MMGVNDSACVCCLELPTQWLEVRHKLPRTKGTRKDQKAKEQCTKLCVKRRNKGSVI